MVEQDGRFRRILDQAQADVRSRFQMYEQLAKWAVPGSAEPQAKST